MKRLVVAACLIATMLPSLGASDQRARVLMQAAEAKVTVEGDLPAAIKLYKDAEKEAGANRALVAQVLVKMADAYRTLGDAQAQRIYRRIVEQFGDQKAAVEVARLHLAPNKTAPTGAMLRDIADLNASGNVTADGRYASYVNWETGNIAVRDLVAGTSRELTARTDYAVYNPALSRNGRFVAYESFNTCGSAEYTVNPPAVLCVLPVAGEPAASARTVLEGVDIKEIQPMDWSPDNASIAVLVKRADGNAQIAMLDVNDRSLRVLQSTDWRGSTRAFFSPDGRYLAFDVVNAVTDQQDVQVVAVDGSAGGTVVQHPSQNVVMGWTPDGLNVLFASDRAGSLGLWAQRTVNGKSAGAPRLVHAGLGGALSLGITTDGSLYFGVQSGDSDIEIVTIDPATGKQMSAPVRPLLGYVGMNRMPAWSPDGRYLAYVSRREVSGSSGRVIGIGDVSAGSVRELYPRLTYMERLAWAPDRLTLITDGRDLRGRSGIFSIDVRSGETTFVAEGRFPSYSSDGTHLYFVTPGSMPPNAVVERNLASGSERTIIKGELATYTLSPDGKWLAVAHGSGSVATDVVAVSVENGQAHVIYQSPANEGIPPYVGLAWTPDSHAVLMRKRVPNEELWLVPITGEPPRKVDVDIRGWAFGPVGSVSLHPDGRQLAGTRVREDRGAEVRVLENFLPALK